MSLIAGSWKLLKLIRENAVCVRIFDCNCPSDLAHFEKKSIQLAFINLNSIILRPISGRA